VETTTANGTLTLGTNGGFTYVPNPNFSGTDSFTYRASDGPNQSNTATVTITVTPVNDAPNAVNDARTVAAGGQLTVAAPGILANDTDQEGQSLTASLAPQGGPANGSLSFNADGSFIYTPDPGFVGADSFVYLASDGTDTGTATVAITVNSPPTAVPDNYSFGEESTLTVPAAGVLSNDTDPESNPLTAEVVTQPASGTLTFNADGSFTYVPVLNFTGVVSFSYRANDGFSNSAPAVVSLTVTNANDAPEAENDSFQMDEGGTLTVPAPGVLTNDSDPDPGDTLTPELITGPLHGSVTLGASGGFTYIPESDFSGTDSFTYHVNDGLVDSTPATVTITVSGDNDAPIAQNNTFGTDEDTPLPIDGPGVLANDSDPDGDNLTATLVDGPASGTLTLDPDGSFLYAPVGNFNGTVSFTYVAGDGTLTSNTATVTINVTAVNDLPVANADSYFVPINSPLEVVAPGVLANDTDVEGDPLTAAVVVGPGHGSLTLNSNGRVVYTPEGGFTGADSFSYQANDPSGASPVAVVTITVHATNDAPVAADDSYTAAEDTTLIIPLAASVLANDTDADGDSLVAIVDDGPDNGTLTLDTNGRFTYVPNSGFTGTDSFTYRALDGADFDTAVVTITVEAGGGEGEAPLSLSDAAILAYLASLDANDPLSIFWQSSPDNWASVVDQVMAELYG
jgi:VCBS repeat-containing protein